MELRVNDYVRTKHFGINKIKGFYSDNHYDYIMVNDDLIKKEDIVISSPNIIDLIEVGDYVNGMQVTRICFDEDGQRILNLSNCILELMNEDIKSIVTKEQFSQIEYKVGE